MEQNLSIIGELMNNSYGRARRAWSARDLDGYRQLAKLQTGLGASCLTLNIDGTQRLSVTMAEMLEFLPRLVPAIQEVTRLPLSFDNPHVAFHEEAVKHFDQSKCDGRPILNSISVSRQDVDGMVAIAARHDMNIIVMASECFKAGGQVGACEGVDDVVGVTRHYVGQLQAAGIENDRIIVDPGLAPIASDTQGIINLCLDSIRALRADPDLAGIHISVGLSNFSIGVPGHLRVPLERAFLRLAMDAGLDWALANPEKNTVPMDPDEPLVGQLQGILDAGRPQDGEAPEEAGYRQLDELMELWGEA